MPRRVSRVLLSVLILLPMVEVPVLAYRSRMSSNEGAAVNDLRALLTAQYAYAHQNGTGTDGAEPRFEGRLECLLEPGRCIPADPAGLRLPAEFGTPERRGYRFALMAGVPVPAGEISAARMSPSTVRSFAYVAVPVRPTSKASRLPACIVPASRQPTGMRGFCGDATGVICYTDDGTAPVRDGRCEPCPNKIE